MPPEGIEPSTFRFQGYETNVITDYTTEAVLVEIEMPRS
jgi:hypothetical protein